jgi:transglutaminase-like putative cysteine protease
MLTVRRIILYGLLLALLTAPARAVEPVTQETWEVMQSGQTDFASIHTVREQLPDGNQRIVEQTRYLFDLLGQRQELRETHEWVVSAELTPISCQTEVQGNAAASAAQGRVEDGSLVVVVERAGTRLERKISLEGKPICAVTLSQFLARQQPEAQRVEFAVINDETWKLRKATARRLPAVADMQRWGVVYGKGDEEDIWTIDAIGRRHETKLTQTERTIRRATPEQAAAIKHLTFAPRELLAFPVKRHIPFPERARSIRTRLTWKDTPLESMNLEDFRQHIDRQSHEQEKYAVELQLTQPGTIENAPPIPVTDPSLAEFLGEDEFIRPNDPSIRDRAKEWSAGSVTTLEAVRKLTHQVSEFLRGGEMIAETLSGPEVLACRKGKCSEFTTLLASLTRSVGVPTRVALGMRLVSGQWMGHMWCEVWVGRWIPVDATADEVGGSPALLKLTHSDTVAGTQKVRWAMTKSLDVELLDFEPGAVADLGLKTGIVRQTYIDADFACRITAPEDWTLHDKSAPGTPTIQFKIAQSSAESEPLVHFVAFALPTKLDAAVLVNARKVRFKSMYKEFEVLTDEPHKVGELSGRRFCFRRQDPKSPDKNIKTTEILWTDGRSGYLVNLIAEESAHDSLAKQFEQIPVSFESLGGSPAERAK